MENTNQPQSDGDRPVAGAAEDRRGFFAQAVALLLGIVALLVPAAVGIVAFLSPLRRRKEQDDDEYTPLASLDMLPADGTPQRFTVIADRSDAWNFFPNEPIGAVFLRRTGQQEVQAFNASCPHAGCPIQYHGKDAPDETKRNRFVCPCHTAFFEVTGERVAGMHSDSPRDLDPLQWKIEGTEVRVKFQDFKWGTSEPKVRT